MLSGDPPQRAQRLTKVHGGEEDRRGRGDRSESGWGTRVAHSSTVESHRAQAEHFNRDEACPPSCRLGGACAQKLTAQNMINAHEFVNGYVVGGGGGDDDGGGDVVAAATVAAATVTVKPGEVAKRRRIIIVQALASNAEGRGFMVDGIGVCKALCQRAHGISDFLWNTTAADVYAGRPVKGLESSRPAPQRPQPRRPISALTQRPIPQAALNQLSAVEACNEAAEATVTILEAAEAALVTAHNHHPAPTHSSYLGWATSSSSSSSTTTTTTNAQLPMPQHTAAASFQQMVEGLSGAPTQVLLDAVGKLHAAALQRGVLLTQSDRAARRGHSAVNHNFMPRNCSECEESGEWCDDGSTTALVCCNECITVVHQTFSCSGRDPYSMEQDGWQCPACWAVGDVIDGLYD